MGNNQTTEQKKKTIVSIEDDGFITRTWPPVGKINIKYSDGTTEGTSPQIIVICL